MIEIVAHGTCCPNPCPGGWAARIIEDGTLTLAVGQVASTNGFRMELVAALEAMRMARPDAAVTVVSDSSYLVDGMTSWTMKWQRRGWGRILNRDLWEALLEVAGERAAWQRISRAAWGHHQVAADAMARWIATCPVPNPTFAAAEFPTYVSYVHGLVSLDPTWSQCQARVHRQAGACFKKCHCDQELFEALARWQLPIGPALLRTSPV